MMLCVVSKSARYTRRYRACVCAAKVSAVHLTDQHAAYRPVQTISRPPDGASRHSKTRRWYWSGALASTSEPTHFAAPRSNACAIVPAFANEFCSTDAREAV